MRKLRPFLYLAGLALFAVLLSHARSILPMDTRPLVAEKYAGWSGVLRLWVFEGWECGAGSLSAWLNLCISGFEKRHPGVYVQPKYVDAGAIASFNDSGILPPDLLLFPPGLLESPEGLAPLDLPDSLRSALSEIGSWNGSTYAVPVAMGGYLWAWNASLIDLLPNSWLESDAVLAVPEPEAWRRWDGALLALCSARFARDAPDDAESNLERLPGIDLRLGTPDLPETTESPTGTYEASQSCQLPTDFQYDADAWRHFINGEAAAIPVTQREIRRLQNLSEQGRGPDWRLSRGGGAFTDQLLNLAIVDKPNAGQQHKLCVEFLSWLLTDDCQGLLSRAGAFSVTSAPSGYASSEPLAELEDALRDKSLAAPNVFDGSWKSCLEGIVRGFLSQAAGMPELWQAFRDKLANNPNDHADSSSIIPEISIP